MKIIIESTTETSVYLVYFFCYTLTNSNPTSLLRMHGGAKCYRKSENFLKRRQKGESSGEWKFDSPRHPGDFSAPPSGTTPLSSGRNDRESIRNRGVCGMETERCFE